MSDDATAARGGPTAEDVKRIAAKVLAAALRNCERDGAAPLLVVGASHVGPNAGNPVVYRYENLQSGDLPALLRRLADAIESAERRRAAEKN